MIIELTLEILMYANIVMTFLCVIDHSLNGRLGVLKNVPETFITVRGRNITWYSTDSKRRVKNG